MPENHTMFGGEYPLRPNEGEPQDSGRFSKHASGIFYQLATKIIYNNSNKNNNRLYLLIILHLYFATYGLLKTSQGVMIEQSLR